MISSMNCTEIFVPTFLIEMRGLLINIVNLYLYSSLHIGVCCVLLYLFSMERLGLAVDVRFSVFLFSSTIFTYSIHRIIGMQKVSAFAHQGRFAIINQYRSHIIFYALLSGAVCFYVFLQFSQIRILYLGGAGLISILYTLPIFGETRRLRDFAFVKIFLIAIVWSFVTESISLIEAKVDSHVIILLFVERFFFFIGISIPFDIRDRYVDASNNVSTLATQLTVRQATLLAITCVSTSIVVTVMLGLMGNIAVGATAATVIAYALTLILIWKVLDENRKREDLKITAMPSAQNDYLFSGVIDGTIMLPYICLQMISLYTT